jgi:hypothetical protein
LPIFILGRPRNLGIGFALLIARKSPRKPAASTGPGVSNLKAIAAIPLFGFLMLWTTPSALPQAPPTSPPDPAQLKAEEPRLYADAHPYIDETFDQMKKDMHDLKDLEPASNQESLPHLLAQIGAKADALLRQVPDLISDEVVTEFQQTEPDVKGSNCIGLGCYTPDKRIASTKKFSYIILRRADRNVGQVLDEYRTARSGQPASQDADAIRFIGFVATWIIFSSPNQVEAHFRYLGQQKIEGRDTFVIGFAQIPGLVEFPGRIMSPMGSIPMLLQGIVWVDPQDLSIIRLRTDILAPRPEVGLQRQTARIRFGSVHIAAADLNLWLPHDVDIEMDAPNQHFEEHHHYTNYRLFQVKVKIL